jgi:dephospho-CoA kinase
MKKGAQCLTAARSLARLLTAMKIIGITGIIGSGKSTVAGFLRELGAEVINADEIGHQVYEPGTTGWSKMVAAFGDEILTKGGQIDRSKLGQIVFESNTARARLNSITHPLITREIQAQLSVLRQRKVSLVVIEAALLIEAGWESLIDELWVTTAPREVIYRRLKTRNGMPRAAILARIKAQMPVNRQRQYATRVIDTNISLEKLRARIIRLRQKAIS